MSEKPSKEAFIAAMLHFKSKIESLNPNQKKALDLLEIYLLQRDDVVRSGNPYQIDQWEIDLNDSTINCHQLKIPLPLILLKHVTSACASPLERQRLYYEEYETIQAWDKKDKDSFAVICGTHDLSYDQLEAKFSQDTK